MDISVWGNAPTVRKKENLYLTSQITVPIFDYFEYRIVDGTPQHTQFLAAEAVAVRSIDPNAIQRHLPTCCYNCHGLSLASRRGWLNEVELVVNNDSYRPLISTDILLAGDLVAYSDIDSGLMKIVHTGLVSDVPQNTTVENVLTKLQKCIILSKWGMRGEYIHELFLSPYSGSSTFSVEFFRFSRASY